MSYFHFVFLIRKKLDFTLLAPVGAGVARTAWRLRWLSCSAQSTVF